MLLELTEFTVEELGDGFTPDLRFGGSSWHGSRYEGCWWSGCLRTAHFHDMLEWLLVIVILRQRLLQILIEGDGLILLGARRVLTQQGSHRFLLAFDDFYRPRWTG